MGNLTPQIECGDCIEIMATMADHSVAACITDPPYNYEFIGRSWDTNEVERRIERAKDSSTLVKNIPYGSGLAGGVRNGRWYERNRENVVEYLGWCREWSSQLFRLCKAGSPVAVFSSTRSLAHVQVALEDAGFYARDVLVYRRSSGIPKGLNLGAKLLKMKHVDAKRWDGWHSCFRGEWEAIVLVQKPLLNNYWNTVQATGLGVFKTLNSDGSFQSNILEGFKKSSLEKKLTHCTAKPLALVKRLIELLVPYSKDNLILDPFAGSGTTLVAAMELGYPSLGIEIEPQYVDNMRARILDSDVLQTLPFAK